MDNNSRFPGNDIHPTAVIGPKVIMGSGNYIGPYCVIGMPGEHRGKWGTDAGVVIGNGNRITGHVTIDAGIDFPTRIFDNVMLMKHSHVGHDAVIQRGVTVACGAKIGGHAALGEYVNVGLNAVIHQQHRVHAWCMIGMGAVLPLKVTTSPGHTYVGNPARSIGPNKKAPTEIFPAKPQKQIS